MYLNKILVTGANGQLGTELMIVAKKLQLFNWIFVDVENLDLTDELSVKRVFAELKPDIVINCAAYTAVDKAEEDQELAFKVNTLVPKLLANEIKKLEGLLIQISTDYVFDGNFNYPISIDTKTNALSVYGKSKEEAEKEIIASGCNYIIVRTSWLYSSTGNNFVKTILKLSREKDKLSIIADQIGSPTYAFDLAEAIANMILKYLKNKSVSEIYHFANTGVASWFDFAIAIAEMSKNQCEIVPIKTVQYPLPAQRPHYSVLDTSKYTSDFDTEIPYWRDSLKKCMKIILNTN